MNDSVTGDLTYEIRETNSVSLVWIDEPNRRSELQPMTHSNFNRSSGHPVSLGPSGQLVKQITYFHGMASHSGHGSQRTGTTEFEIPGDEDGGRNAPAPTGNLHRKLHVIVPAAVLNCLMIIINFNVII